MFRRLLGKANEGREGGWCRNGAVDHAAMCAIFVNRSYVQEGLLTVYPKASVFKGAWNEGKVVEDVALDCVRPQARQVHVAVRRHAPAQDLCATRSSVSYQTSLI